ncbi:hypothetical protein ACXYN8_04185 [Altererythrobacter sp. CAU 1778]
MGLILIVIGAVAGWKIADLHPRSFLLLALAAIMPTAAAVMLDPMPHGPVGWIAVWLVTFLYVAVPYALLATLRRARARNRTEEQ